MSTPEVKTIKCGGQRRVRRRSNCVSTVKGDKKRCGGRTREGGRGLGSRTEDRGEGLEGVCDNGGVSN